MDSLKALLAAKKKEKQELVGDKKYVRKSELEEAKLKRLRAEEEAERAAKEEKRRRLGGSGVAGAREGSPTGAGGSGAPGDGSRTPEPAAGKAGRSAAEEAQAAKPLPREEVIRRLRALSQPATLFGEDDADRQARLAKVEKTVALVDETRGGQQENVMLQLKRADKLKKAAGGAGGGAGSKAAADGEGPAKPPASRGGGEGGAPGSAAPGEGAGNAGGAADGAAAAGAAGDDEAALLARFQDAAARVAAARADESLPIEDRMAKLLRAWCKEWEEDLEARSDEVKMSGAGNQATLVFRQAMTYFEPLYERLAKRQLVEELKVGLWMMVSHMRDRNYLAANDVYLKLAIGNAPWPIGVTQVGLHERSAREKISHAMNSTSQAHIMNDEATRKYFQAIKRLMTALQRLRPTDPSRSVDFDVAGNEGRGVAGAGSNRAALLEAQARGELPLALPAAPHLVANDGSVKIPPKWESVLRRQAKGMGLEDYGKGSGSDDNSRPPSRGARA